MTALPIAPVVVSGPASRRIAEQADQLGIDLSCPSRFGDREGGEDSVVVGDVRVRLGREVPVELVMLGTRGVDFRDIDDDERVEHPAQVADVSGHPRPSLFGYADQARP